MRAAPVQQPLGKWVVDYGDTLCTASRTYGRQEAPMTLALRPSPNGTVVRLLIVRPGKAPLPEHFAVTTSITPAKAKTTGLRFASGNKKSEIIWINFERAALEGLRTASEFALQADGIVNERFALPGIGAVLGALDRCNADLRAHWNLIGTGAAQVAKTATSVRPLASYFSPNDYPAQALHEGAGGATRVAMMVDETGALKECMVEETSGIASLDAVTCGLLIQRAKFNPARDAAGKPLRSVSTSRIRWVTE